MTAEGKGLIAYCGLYCGDCVNYQRKVADLAKDLRKALREARFAKIAPGLSRHFEPFADYERCYEVLGAMVKLRCKRGCHSGGGPPFCKIRGCCQKKGFPGCWECGEFEACEKLKFLEAVHQDAHLKNLRHLKVKGAEGFLTGKREW